MKDCQAIAQASSPIDTGNMRHNSIKAYLLNDGFVIEQRFNVAWYGTLLNERDYTRKDNGKTTRGWWTNGVYGAVLKYTNDTLNNQQDMISAARQTIAKTAKDAPKMSSAIKSIPKG